VWLHLLRRLNRLLMCGLRLMLLLHQVKVETIHQLLLETGPLETVVLQKVLQLRHGAAFQLTAQFLGVKVH
jgi:hypothetical protein